MASPGRGQGAHARVLPISSLPLPFTLLTPRSSPDFDDDSPPPSPDALLVPRVPTPPLRSLGRSSSRSVPVRASPVPARPGPSRPGTGRGPRVSIAGCHNTRAVFGDTLVLPGAAPASFVLIYRSTNSCRFMWEVSAGLSSLYNFLALVRFLPPRKLLELLDLWSCLEISKHWGTPPVFAFSKAACVCDTENYTKYIVW